VHGVVIFGLAMVMVLFMHRFIWRLADRGITIVDLFGGEKLIAYVRGRLRIDNEEAGGVLGLTDMRIVWAPRHIVPGTRQLVASAMDPDAIAITLGEIRHASSTWGFFQSTLRLETPSGVFILKSSYGSFGAWLRYLSENARNLLKTGEPVTLLEQRTTFTDHALARAKYGSAVGTLLFGALTLANLLRTGVLFGSTTVTVVLALFTLVSFVAGLILLARPPDKS
jgi:hypothetical protein